MQSKGSRQLEDNQGVHNETYMLMWSTNTNCTFGPNFAEAM